MENWSSSSPSSSPSSSSVTPINKKSPSSSTSWSIHVVITVALILIISPLLFSKSHHHHHSSVSIQEPHSFIKNTCTNITLYPSLCLHTFSSSSSSILDLQEDSDNTSTRLVLLLHFSINKTINSVTRSRSRLINSSAFSSNSNSWVDNCIELLDQTLYELQESIKRLLSIYPPPYAAIKNLLSAAMTNENTCIEGFSSSSYRYSSHDHQQQKQSSTGGHRLGLRYLQKSLTPIMRMISNSLAIVNYIEQQQQRHISTTRLLLSNGNVGIGLNNHVPSWMSYADHRRLMQIPRPRPTVVVAMDGSGNFTTITAAVSAAPNRTTPGNRFVILIKAGIYNENLVIPRNKVNIMLVGQGMNSTILTGSRNFVDGYTTFTSATLTVIGNNFMARDLTIINTSGPEKRQAVAVRVTSDAAFYHCQFISNQDTLYAHSLSQLYRECAIHGTVDFIFGNAAAIFHRCLILVRKPILGQRNVITAQGRLDPNQNTGISLEYCTIMASPEFSIADRANFSTFLGRPWRNYSRTIVMRSYLGDIIDPQGWCAWDKYSNLNTIDYIEYMNFGPGADTKKRVQWAGYHSNSSRDVDKFSIQSFLPEANEWLRSTNLPLCSGLYAKDCKTGGNSAEVE
uniref:pectinesterase-like n=1 Tax=Erigeron canadensis TaxID=72917 RepID=UPI001CB94088|nr:pectinesterase-like [Erigeron canadensis]